MVRSLPGSGVPFLSFAAYSIPCHLISINGYGFDRVNFYFVMELQSGRQWRPGNGTQMESI